MVMEGKCFTFFDFFSIIMKACIQKARVRNQQLYTTGSSIFLREGVTIVAWTVLFECGRRDERICGISLPKQYYTKEKRKTMYLTKFVKKMSLSIIAVLILVLVSLIMANDASAASTMTETVIIPGDGSAIAIVHKPYIQTQSISHSNPGWLTINRDNYGNFTTFSAKANTTGSIRKDTVTILDCYGAKYVYNVIQCPKETTVSLSKEGTAKKIDKIDTSLSLSVRSEYSSWLKVDNNAFTIRSSSAYYAQTNESRIGYVDLKKGSKTYTTYKVVQSPYYKVRLDAAGGNFGYYMGTPMTVMDKTIIPNNTFAVEDLPTPMRDGYKFLGWYKATSGVAGGVKATTSTKVTESHTLYAHWMRTYYFSETGGKNSFSIKEMSASTKKYYFVDSALSTAKGSRPKWIPNETSCPGTSTSIEFSCTANTSNAPRYAYVYVYEDGTSKAVVYELIQKSPYYRNLVFSTCNTRDQNNYSLWSSVYKDDIEKYVKNKLKGIPTTKCIQVGVTPNGQTQAVDRGLVSQGKNGTYYDFVYAWNNDSSRQYGVVLIDCHGNSTQLLDSYRTPMLSASDVDKLNYKHIECIVLVACECGHGGANTIAAKLANKFQCPVIAADGDVNKLTPLGLEIALTGINSGTICSKVKSGGNYGWLVYYPGDPYGNSNGNVYRWGNSHQDIYGLLSTMASLKNMSSNRIDKYKFTYK